MVPAPLWAAALQAPSPHVALHQLHQLALNNGANDNLSIGIVDILQHTLEDALPTAQRRTRTDVKVLS